MQGIVRRIRDRVQGRAPAHAKRSSRWPHVRKEHLAKHPRCALCGGTKKLEVHHKLPFHVAPHLELDPANLITLCEAKRNGVTCHQFFGHLGNYKLFNEHVEADVELWRAKMSLAREEQLDHGRATEAGQAEKEVQEELAPRAADKP